MFLKSFSWSESGQGLHILLVKNERVLSLHVPKWNILAVSSKNTGIEKPTFYVSFTKQRKKSDFFDQPLIQRPSYCHVDMDSQDNALWRIYKYCNKKKRDKFNLVVVPRQSGAQTQRKSCWGRDCVHASLHDSLTHSGLSCLRGTAKRHPYGAKRTVS